MKQRIKEYRKYKNQINNKLEQLGEKPLRKVKLRNVFLIILVPFLMAFCSLILIVMYIETLINPKKKGFNI